MVDRRNRVFLFFVKNLTQDCQFFNSSTFSLNEAGGFLVSKKKIFDIHKETASVQDGSQEGPCSTKQKGTENSASRFHAETHVAFIIYAWNA